jgi:hypothetical protein
VSLQIYINGINAFLFDRKSKFYAADKTLATQLPRIDLLIKGVNNATGVN